MSALAWLIVALVVVVLAVGAFVAIRLQNRKGGVIATRRRPRS